MSSAGKAKTMKQRLLNFRLTAASVILGNLANTGHLTEDMQSRHHIAELCEQYSFLILLIYLSTKYGLAVFRSLIYEESPDTSAPMLSRASLANRYPFYSYESLSKSSTLDRSLEYLIEQNFPADLEVIGQLHQQTLAMPLAIRESGEAYIEGESDNRTGGEFYTPSLLTDYAMESWFNANSADLLKRFNSDNVYDWPLIMDPACGSGNFLLAAVRLFRGLGLPPEKTLNLARHCLLGADIDGKALELARFSLVLALAPEIKLVSSGSSYAYESKTGPQYGRGSVSMLPVRAGGDVPETVLSNLLQSFDMNLRVSDSILKACSNSTDKYDLIVTNPPYLSFGAREQGRLDAGWQAFLKTRFPASAEYKLRYTSMFQELAIEQTQFASDDSSEAKPEGQAILLVPDAFLTGSYYGKLRQYILQNVKIISLTEFPEKTFPDVTAGRWCLAHYGANGEPGNEESEVSLVEFSGLGLNPRKYSMPFSSFVSRDGKRFQMVFSDEDLEILNLCRDFPWLGNELRGHTGIRSRIGQKAIITEKKLSPKHRAGIISGASVKAHKVTWDGHWLEIDPAKLFAGGFDERVISGPKLLVRQTGDRIVAAPDCSGLFHLNNVHSFVPRNEALRQQLVYYYSCLLNSSFFLYYYRLKTREFQRALAQIDIETVEHMPSPGADPALFSEAEELSKQIAESPEQDRAVLQSKVDSFVYDLFGLRSSLRRHIDSSLCLSS